jgi:hypothetical protein
MPAFMLMSLRGQWLVAHAAKGNYSSAEGGCQKNEAGFMIE